MFWSFIDVASRIAGVPHSRTSCPLTAEQEINRGSSSLRYGNALQRWMLGHSNVWFHEDQTTKMTNGIMRAKLRPSLCTGWELLKTLQVTSEFVPEAPHPHSRSFDESIFVQQRTQFFHVNEKIPKPNPCNHRGHRSACHRSEGRTSIA